MALKGLALLLASASVLGQEPEALDLQTELVRMVDLPDAAARQKAAQRLARRRGVSLQDWVEAAHRFGEFAAQEPGVQRHVVDLSVLGEDEETELFVYVPQAYDPEVAAPLLLMGHGSGGSGQGQHFMWQEVAHELGMLVPSPRT